MTKTMARLGIDTLTLRKVIECRLNKSINEEKLIEYLQGSKIGMYIYDSYSEAYQTITGISNLYKAYDLFPTIDELLEMEIKAGYKSLGEQIIKELDCDEYGLEAVITYDFINKNKSLIVSFDYGVLDDLIQPVLDFDFVVNDIDNIFGNELIINKAKVVEAMHNNGIMFFDNKKDFINHFMEGRDKEELLQYIFNYDSSNDDYINCPEDIAITYLTEELRLFDDRYYIHETTIENNPFYKYIFINTLVNDGCK